jgi:hypothetical protein
MQNQIRALGPEILGQKIYNFIKHKEKDLLRDPVEVARLAVYPASSGGGSSDRTLRDAGRVPAVKVEWLT